MPGARRPLDVPITDLVSAGLPGPSVVRMKRFTLDHRLVLDRKGHLTTADKALARAALAALFGHACGPTDPASCSAEP